MNNKRKPVIREPGTYDWIDLDRLAYLESQLDQVLVENVIFRETINTLRCKILDLEQRISNSNPAVLQRYEEEARQRMSTALSPSNYRDIKYRGKP